jgi:hypothetical protein
MGQVDLIIIGGFMAFIAGAAYWLWTTREKPLTEPFKTFDEPCHCDHPVKCDFYDRCMKNEHS